MESGKRNDRPKLAEALSLCEVHGATLIIAKLDRLARNVNFISNLMESKVEFTAVDFPKANRLTVHMLQKLHLIPAGKSVGIESLTCPLKSQPFEAGVLS